jgi:RNA polymerase primary sigma factor
MRQPSFIPCRALPPSSFTTLLPRSPLAVRLVVSIVRPYLAPNAVAGGALSMEDLVQEGSVGLMKAVTRFNPERGHRFSTYATWWIRTTVQRAVADQARTIRLPFGKSRMLSKAKRTHDTLQQQYGRKPTEEELATELDVPRAQLRVLMQHWHGVGSLEAPIVSRGPSSGANTGRTSTLLEAYRSRPQQQRTPEDSVEVTLVSDCLKELLEHELSPIEATVLSLRYGLEDGAALSWKQIAAKCEMPEKQLQLAQSRALRKLRKQRALRQLKAFCDHEDWEKEALGHLSPGERLGAR